MHAHHAYLVIAPSLELAELPEHAMSPSVDVEHVSSAQFGIDDARRLAQKAIQRPIVSESHTFVVATGSLTSEAQNALLKLFEDPPSHARFYLIVPHESALLPTLRSRLLALQGAASEMSDAAEDFLRQPLASRLSVIADMQKRKDSEGMQKLATALAAHAARHAREYPPQTLRAAQMCEECIRRKGAAKKMLLEHVALSFP